jgi:4-diphosphocytidyl-2-C-methyl-D-erythritol kinase
MSSMSLTLSAPGKVNFGLRILGRRADGYHRLESLFLPIDLADTLQLSLRARPGISLTLAGDCGGVPGDECNLAVRAAGAFLAEAGSDRGVGIRLEKRLPAPGGLGGGSSDAGAVLRGLSELMPGAVSPRSCVRSLRLGADVPFFWRRRRLVGGIGEEILPVEGLPSLALLLAHPGAPLATSAVYAAYDAGAGSLTASGPGPSIRALLALREEAGRARAGPIETSLCALVVNDLEPAASRLIPAVLELRKEIEAAGASAVSLSGSGPTVFGVFPSEAAAEEAQRRLPRRAGLRTWVVKTAPAEVEDRARRPAPRRAGAQSNGA